MKRRICHSMIVAGTLALSLFLCGFSTVESRLFKPSWRDCPPEAATVDLRDLESGELEEAIAVLQGLDGLELVLLGEQESCPLSWEDIERLRAAVPQADIDYSFGYGSRRHNLSDEVLDLSEEQISDDGAMVRRIMSCMKNLRTVDMDRCGLDDETMARLRDDYPGIQVVWRVYFGERYSVRTDTLRILASAPDFGGELLTENTQSLKYCTKVRYLDLGHNNNLGSVDFVRYMPELEVAILAMLNVEDYSALAECPKLEYLELFTSRLHDLTPLSGLTELRHLNICYNFAINDISPLFSLTQLERLWIGAYDPVPPEQVAQMQELAPGCMINVSTLDPTEEGWRLYGGDAMGNPTYHPRYALLREQFGYQDVHYDIDSMYSFGW